MMRMWMVLLWLLISVSPSLAAVNLSEKDWQVLKSLARNGGGGIAPVTAFPTSPAPTVGQTVLLMTDSAKGACDEGGGIIFSVCAWDGIDWVSAGDGAGSTVNAWPGDSTVKEITWANALVNAVTISGGGSRKWVLYDDSTEGLIFTCYNSAVLHGCDKGSKIISTFKYFISDASDNRMFNFAPNAATAYSKYAVGTLKPIGSIAPPLYPRGAAAAVDESIVTNQPKTTYLTVTDVDTDAGDFSFQVPASWSGATTLTFRLVGVSKNASPSGNIAFDCAVKRYTPGTDTYAAHSTTGQVRITLTPATQNRPVAATSSAHTINGGALVAGDVVFGSCEVDATATTSAQMTDFRLRGDVLVQASLSSLSD